MRWRDVGSQVCSVARTLSDSFGVMVSAGKHCAHSLHKALGVGTTLRASAWIFTTPEDVDHLIDSLALLIA